MSSDEVGNYIRLLSYQWLKPENGLPDDNEKLVRISRWEKPQISPAVMEKFQKCKDGLLRNPRLEAVRQEREAFCARQAANVGKRWEKPPPKPPKVEHPAKEDSTHHQFIALWHDRFKISMGMTYAMDSGRDGKGTKSILASTKMTPVELVQAVTIHGFASKFNEIRAALKNGVHGKRTIGTNTASDAEF
jgi:uncharacterized protein YdaU (DUF1376 family)